MKKFYTIFTMLAIILTNVHVKAERENIPINNNWHFKGASIWEESVEKNVDIPHTWNTKDAAQGYDYYRGLGTYTKQLYIHEAWQGKRLFLKFEAVQTVADVYINGTHLGQHRGGYSAFAFEITSYVRFGQENSIEVQVDNSKTEDVLPLGGDFNIYGGIYRPVHLLVTNEICITPLDFASPGVYLIQKNISNDKAEIDVLTKVSNGSAADKTVRLDLAISDADGFTVRTGNATVVLKAGETKDVKLPFILQNPRLWNGLADPHLYEVELTIKSGNEVIDRVVQPMGLRYYHTDAEKGFFLNGQHVKIKGISRHNDWAGVASALHESHHRKDMELIKEMGANGIRLAHYQHASFFHSLCDTAGMLVWAEIPFVGSDQAGYTDSEAFRENATQQLQELIRQNYNHPSVLFWGLYNEIGMKNDPVLTEIIDDLQELAKKEDPTRPTVAASFITRSSDDLHKIPDMIAWNQYYGWYYSKPDKLGDFLDRIHEEEPGYKIGISEYGAGGSAIQHEENIRRPFPFYHPWHPEEFQTTVHEGNWKAIAERDFVWGSFLWNMFDFGSHFRREGDAIGINDKGMVSYDRKTKKDVFYFYKANWSSEPVVYITNSRFAIRQNDKIDVKVYSNLDDVELIVNGESLGNTKGDFATYKWENVALQKDMNKVEAIAYKNGQSYSSSVVWMYEKKPAISFGIAFLRWLIKPFLGLLFLAAVFLVWILVKKRPKRWGKALTIIVLVLSVLILAAFIVGQILGAKFGFNLFEYSLL